MRYQDVNAATVDRWVEEGWEWATPVSHEEFARAKEGDWQVKLTPVKPVPREWFGDLRGKKVLGLASGGGQQMPLFTAAGAECTVLDYSQRQLDQETLVAKREGYGIRIVRADMTEPLPFEDGEFDLIFHPVSDCYVAEVEPIWHECHRVLNKGGVLLSGIDNGFNYLVNEENESVIVGRLPYDSLRNEDQRRECEEGDYGYQFSHSMEEVIGGQIRAGFHIADVYEDTNNVGFLYEHGVPCFYALKAVKA